MSEPRLSGVHSEEAGVGKDGVAFLLRLNVGCGGWFRSSGNEWGYVEDVRVRVFIS